MSNRSSYRARICSAGIAVTIDAVCNEGKGWKVRSVRLEADSSVRVRGGADRVRKIPAPLDTYIRLIGAYLEAEPVSLSAIPIDLSVSTPFARSVMLAARTVPYGRTISYAGLATRAGRPGAARAVASVMRRNPVPLLVPCHRVIRSDDTIGGFMGRTSGKAVALKRLLLRRESTRAFPLPDGGDSKPTRRDQR